MIRLDGDVLYHQADVLALLVDSLIKFVVVGITTLVTVALECVPLVFDLFWMML